MWEELASRLETNDAYRVLRRLVRPAASISRAASDEKLGVIIDFETMGLDPSTDDVIEIGMVKFGYSAAGEVTRVVDEFASFNEPAVPIPPEITELTGITGVMVEGRRIDMAKMEEFVHDANLIIAHNANFDRRFAERLSSAFVHKPWACSATQVDWRACGVTGVKLEYLLTSFGHFHEAHRAADDCHAVLALLAKPFAAGPGSVLAELLAQARRETHRVWADGSPFELKDVLKRRGYRWNDGADGSVRAWYFDVGPDKLEAEMEFLRREIYQSNVEVRTRHVTAWERFSDRV
jgi:DNA polymerase-3 subunit epsilon